MTLDGQYVEIIARNAHTTTEQVRAAIDLLTSGATIPFIASYRKDAIGGLSEQKLESIEAGAMYYTSLTQRAAAVLAAAEKAEKLTDELRASVAACASKPELEDIHIAFKKKRASRGTRALEQGLEGLADLIWNQDAEGPALEEAAAPFVNEKNGVASAEEAIKGATAILAERFTFHIATRRTIRARMTTTGKVTSCTTKISEGQKSKFESYYNFSEDIQRIPSHRLLAILRGVREGMLRMELAIDDTALVAELVGRVVTDAESKYREPIRLAIEDSYTRLLRPAIEEDVLGQAHHRADNDAVGVFRENTKSLLMAAAAGGVVVLGVQPEVRSGCHAAVVDAAGAHLENIELTPVGNADKQEESAASLKTLLAKHDVKAVAVGNGTGSREAMRFINKVLAEIGEGGLFAIIVNEAGAAVYATSSIGTEELPELSGAARAAVSIARRLQDPLAEFVKLEPRSVGVGQYQHDVNQKVLREGLHRSVQSCVNRVGVDLNRATVSQLRYISGIQYGTAQNIVAYRTENGPFKSREALRSVEGIGPRIYEQSIGFLRILDGENPLDATRIHPDAYATVQAIATTLETTVAELIKNVDALKTFDLSPFISETIGALGLEDIRNELLNPGRDPRKAFRAPRFKEGVEKLEDLKAGMEVEGIVTNVTNFGAFVDIGTSQDGLIHLSELANRYVRDPRQVVHVGEIVQVKVISVDPETPRVSLSRKALLRPSRKRNKPRKERKGGTPQTTRPQERTAESSKRQPDGARRKPRRGNGKPRKSEHRKPQRDSGQPQEKAEPMNTQLADQLAALKDKLGS